MLFLVFAVVFVTGCQNSRKIPTNFDYGSWTDSTYRNDFFGFSLTIPSDWHISGQEEMKALTQQSQDMAFVDQKEMKKFAKIAEITAANLFFVARYTEEEAASHAMTNFNIGMIAENISSADRMDRAKYVSLSRQNLTKAMPGAVIKSETNTNIGGQEFTSMEVELEINGVRIHQEYLIALKHKFALCMVLTWFVDSERQQLKDILATIKWD